MVEFGYLVGLVGLFEPNSQNHYHTEKCRQQSFASSLLQSLPVDLQAAFLLVLLAAGLLAFYVYLHLIATDRSFDLLLLDFPFDLLFLLGILFALLEHLG